MYSNQSVQLKMKLFNYVWIIRNYTVKFVYSVLNVWVLIIMLLVYTECTQSCSS